jgi:hypothetical protein
LSKHGFTVGGGVEFKAFRLRISPELRYTRWGGDSNVLGFAKSDQNQAQLLVGLTF